MTLLKRSQSNRRLLTAGAGLAALLLAASCANGNPQPAAGGGNGSGGAPDARWQEVATKLDLAKAYEEMGDKDGARELLKEVVKEGDTAQQQQAQTMLQALG